MGLEKIGGQKRDQKSSRQEEIRTLRLQGKPVLSGEGLNRTSKMFVEAVARSRGGMSKTQIQKKLQKIKNKLRSGARLTGEEKEFLREHAPELYRKVIALERERAAYEEQLKAAKTRDDAENIRMSKMMMEAALAKKEDAEFVMIRMAQMQAAEAETKQLVSSKPWKREISREQKERLERAAKSQIHTEKRMKRLRRWDNGQVKEIITGEEAESWSDQGTSLWGLPEQTKELQETVRLVKTQMAVPGSMGTAGNGAESELSIGVSQGKAVYSAVAAKVTDDPQKEDETLYSKKA